MAHREIFVDERKVRLHVFDPMPSFFEHSRGTDRKHVVTCIIANLRH